MNSKQQEKIVAMLFILSVFLLVSCADTSVTRDTVYVPVPECYEKSNVFDLEFSFPCGERERAQLASAVCDLMGSSALSLIDTNRRIGPTTAKDLFVTSGIENMPTIKIVYKALGEEGAKAYIKDIWDMSVYISERNLTDRTLYPKQKFNRCLGEFKYRAER